MNPFPNAKLLCGVLFLGLSSPLRASDLAQEYNQVKKIAMKDPKVRAAFERANEKLNKRILKIDPALKPFIEAQGAGKKQDEPTRAPAPTGRATHIVAQGDTLWSIARRYKVSVSSLTKANGISREATLKIGQKLVIPALGQS